jgi:hypothetical protein
MRTSRTAHDQNRYLTADRRPTADPFDAVVGPNGEADSTVSAFADA